MQNARVAVQLASSEAVGSPVDLTFSLSKRRRIPVFTPFNCMQEEMVLENGTRVMTSGMVITEGGKKTELENGDLVTWDGMIIKAAVAAATK